jgi:hypothetical protein
MSQEFLLVEFHESRQVIIDDHEQGNTNETIQLVGGQHTVTLDGVHNFTPLEQTVLIINTTLLSPYVLQFS